MGNRRTLLVATAVVLAVVAGFAVFTYASGADRRARADVEVVDALVASTDIPKGTTGAQAIAAGAVVVARVLRGSVPPAAVVDPSTVRDRVTAATIQTGQFITEATFVTPAQGGGGALAAAIGTSDQVAVTIEVDAARGVANQIAPGDRVDLIGGGPVGAYLYRGVRVLAVGAETAATTNGGNGQPSADAVATGLITFAVTPDQALAIVNANRDGGIYLTLQAPTAVAATGSR